MNALAILLATTVNFTVQTATHPDDFQTNVTYTMYDRLVYGGVMPVENLNSGEMDKVPVPEMR